MSMLSFSDFVSSTRSELVGQTHSRDSNLELHIEMSESTDSESEAAVKIPVSIETDGNESSTNERESDHVRQEAEYTSDTVPKEVYGNAADSYFYRDAFDRDEPDGQSSDDTSAPVAAVQTRPVVTVLTNIEKDTQKNGSHLTVCRLWTLCINSSSDQQCGDSESEISDTSAQNQTRQGMGANMNDNQTRQQDSFDSDELFGSGHG